MGKNFFSRKTKSDFFETPYSFTEQLLENEKFDYNRTVLEPACGNGAISKKLEDCFGTKQVFYDRFTLGDFIQRNFLTEKNRNFDYIITNPPFSLWDEFVKKAKEIAKEKFAFLGRLEFLTGISRFKNNLYNDPEYPLTKVYIFVRKVNLSYTKEYPKLRDDGKYPAGMYHYAWFIFEKQDINKLYSNSIICIDKQEYPIIRWINNQKYILKSGD